MPMHKINGRSYYLSCENLTITKVGNGTFDVVSDGRESRIVGGRESGGAPHEWFVYCPGLYGERYVPTTSKIEALRMCVAG